MKKNILLQIFLVLSFVLLSNKVYAVQDSIWPRTAKGAWDPARQQLKWDLGFESPILFKAYPEKDIDPNDTILCVKTNNQFGGLTISWNGLAYKWVFECRVPELSKDSMYKITVHLELLKPVFIKRETIYKPITEYADTTGIAEDSWFDSDSIYRIKEYSMWQFLPSVSLERGAPFWGSYSGKEVMWNTLSMGRDFPVSWICLDARTGKILEKGVVSVTEPDNPGIDKVDVVPNPSNNTISIQTNKEVTSVNLYSMLGQKLCEWTAVQPHQKLSIAHLSEGMYMVQYVDGGTLHSIPMVIAR